MHFVENFNKNKTESKIVNTAHSFRETNLALSKLEVKLS